TSLPQLQLRELTPIPIYLIYNPFTYPMYRTPSHRHSFPTRRSSDLFPLPVQEVLHPPQISGALLAHRGGEQDGPRRGQARRHDRDRKSTRLNSSHQIISYAVFCLEKKK